MYVYKHFEFILLHLQLYSIHILKTENIPTYSPKSHKSVHFIQILLIVLAFLSIVLALCSMILLSYSAQNYAGIMPSLWHEYLKII